LHSVAPIPISLPKIPGRKGDISNGLSVPGEANPFGRNPSEKGIEQFGVWVKAKELAAVSLAVGEYFLSVLGGKWRRPPKWACGQLDRLGRRLAKKSAPLIERPYLALPIASIDSLEDVEFPVRGPAAACNPAAALPAGKQLVQV
jgi:hypothetical protein